MKIGAHGDHGLRHPWGLPCQSAGQRGRETHRPAASVCVHVAVDLEAGGVVGGKDGVDAVLLLSAEEDVQTVTWPRACAREGREGGLATARAPPCPLRPWVLLTCLSATPRVGLSEPHPL